MGNILDEDIVLKPLTDADVNLFINWLNKDHIYKWFCPDGETEKMAWIDEIKKRNNEYRHYNHFIVNYKNIKIGFCIYFDIYFEQEYSKEIYKKTFEKNHAFEIGFCIGEEKYLNKGIGKIIVKKLEEKILEIGGKEILADPDEKNIVSIKTLLSNGFIKIKDGDYRKKII